MVAIVEPEQDRVTTPGIGQRVWVNRDDVETIGRGGLSSKSLRGSQAATPVNKSMPVRYPTIKGQLSTSQGDKGDTGEKGDPLGSPVDRSTLSCQFNGQDAEFTGPSQPATVVADHNVAVVINKSPAKSPTGKQRTISDVSPERTTAFAISPPSAESLALSDFLQACSDAGVAVPTSTVTAMALATK